MSLAPKIELCSYHKLLGKAAVRPSLIIAGGYSAGHITPGIALSEAFSPQVNCIFMGARDGMEASLVVQAGLPFIGVHALPWAGRRASARAASLATLLPAILCARREIKKSGATALISLGSFAALAPSLAAVSLGLPVILYESNTTLGLAHRVLLPFAKTLLTSRLFHQALPRRPAPVTVGVPLRNDILALAHRSVEFPPGAVRVLVLGGSLGNPFFNRRMPDVMRRLALIHPGVSVIHQCGIAIDPTPIIRAYADVGVSASVETYRNPISTAFESIHLVVTTAGAITLHEIAAAGIPALIMPLEGAAARHQHDNAFTFTALTGCPHISEDTWDDEQVSGTLAGLLADPAAWQACSHRLRRFFSPDSASRTLQILRPFLLSPCSSETPSPAPSQ